MPTAASGDAAITFTWWMLLASIGSLAAGAVFVIIKLLDRGGSLPQISHALRREPFEVLNIAIIDITGGLFLAFLLGLTRVSGPPPFPQLITAYPAAGWFFVGMLGPLVADHTFVGRLISRSTSSSRSREAQKSMGSIARAREASVIRIIEALYAVIVGQEAERNAALLLKVPAILKSSPLECDNLVRAVDRYFVMIKVAKSKDVRNYISMCKVSLDAMMPLAADRDEGTPEELFERSYALARCLVNEGHWQPVAVIAK